MDALVDDFDVAHAVSLCDKDGDIRFNNDDEICLGVTYT